MPRSEDEDVPGRSRTLLTGSQTPVPNGFEDEERVPLNRRLTGAAPGRLPVYTGSTSTGFADEESVPLITRPTIVAQERLPVYTGRTSTGFKDGESVPLIRRSTVVASERLPVYTGRTPTGSEDEDFSIIRRPRTETLERPSVHIGRSPTSTVSSVSLLRAVETLREEMKEMKQMLQRVLVCVERGGGGTMDALNLPEDVVLPVSSHEAMEEMELYLQDPVHARRLVDYLSLIGGDNLGETVRATMRTVVGHNLALDFNFTRHGPRKGSFENLRLKSVVFKAIRRSPHIKSGTENQVKKIIQDWFRYAGDRNGGKKRRDKRTQHEQPSIENEQ